MKINPTDTAVAEALAAMGVTFVAAHKGMTTRGDWQCDEWAITFHNRGSGIVPVRELKTEYFTGMGHRITFKEYTTPAYAFPDGKPVAPPAAGVLYSMLMDGMACESSFVDWCNDFGYDTDSRKALETFLACQESGHQLRAFFKHAEREQLSTLLQDY